MQKTLKKIPILIFLFLHFSFLFAAIFENHKNIPVLFILSIIALLLSFFYYKNYKSEKTIFRKLDILLVFLTAFGAIITYALNIELGLGVVLAAGITGLLSSFIPFFNRRSNALREVPVAIYCGSFAGMTAPYIANGYSFILFSGLFSGIILIISKSSLKGFGGKLGTIAFGGVSLMSLILFLFF